MPKTAPPRTITRRNFLDRSQRLLAAGFAAPYFVPSTVLAAPGRVGANDRVQVGYIAFGRRAAQLSLTNDAVRVAVADCNRNRAESQPQREMAARPTRTTASCWTGRISMPSSWPRPIIGTRCTAFTPARRAKMSTARSR